MSEISVWVALDCDEAIVLGVVLTADEGKALAQSDSGHHTPLAWRERRDGRFTSSCCSYEVRPFQVALDQHLTDTTRSLSGGDS